MCSPGRQALFAVLFVATTARATVALPPREELVPGRLIVATRAARGTFAGAHLVRALDDRSYLLSAEDGSADGVAALLARLRADAEVVWAEPEHVRRAQGVMTSDPFLAGQWSLAMARIPTAWSRATGSPEVVVAIIDTGMRPHPDLVNRYLPGWDFISQVDNAGDGDGRDADATDAGAPTIDSSELHGIHIAGIIGAQTDNGIGIAGVDWNCRLLPVRVLGTRGARGSDSDIADAIRWAAGLPVAGVPPNPTPAAVINLSFGGPGGSRVLQAAIDQADARGVIVVASAGNDGVAAAGYAPAGLNHVVTVGAVDDRGQLAEYSNRGPRVDLVAPGGDRTPDDTHGIVSTLWSEKDGYTYAFLYGTSQAAPHVAGVAALMRSIDPTLGGARARTILVATADPARRCGEDCGGGLLNADAALAAVHVACADRHCTRDPTLGRLLIGGCAVSPRGSGGRAIVLALLLLVVLMRRRRATHPRCE